MNNTLIALPEAKNVISKELINRLPVLRRFVSVGTNAEQFFGAVISEANALGFSLDEKELMDPRTKGSFLKSVFNCAVIGLIPGSAMGHAYFVPYKMYRDKPQQHTVIQLIPGYKGLLDLAYSSGWLVQCDSEVVLQGEDCKTWHDNQGPQVDHTIPRPRQPADKENVIGAYCTYKPKGGDRVLGEYVEATELRDLARSAGRRSPWNTGSFVEMSKKTSVRRTSKRWKLTREMALAVDLDETFDRGEEQRPFADDNPDEEATLDLDSLPETDEENANE